MVSSFKLSSGPSIGYTEHYFAQRSDNLRSPESQDSWASYKTQSEDSGPPPSVSLKQSSVLSPRPCTSGHGGPTLDVELGLTVDAKTETQRSFRESVVQAARKHWLALGVYSLLICGASVGVGTAIGSNVQTMPAEFNASTLSRVHQRDWRRKDDSVRVMSAPIRPIDDTATDQTSHLKIGRRPSSDTLNCSLTSASRRGPVKPTAKTIES